MQNPKKKHQGPPNGCLSVATLLPLGPKGRNFRVVSRKFLGRFKVVKGVSRVFGKSSKVCLGSFNVASRVFQGSFKGVLRKFQGCHKRVSRVFQGKLY